MDDREQKYILKYLPQLIDCTTCESSLLEKLRKEKVLSKLECEALITIRNYDGQIAQAYQLYHILFSRPNSYDILLNSLTSQNQREAAEILQTGKLRHFSLTHTRDETDPFLKFPTPPDRFRDLIRNQRLPILVISTSDISMTTQRIQADGISYEFLLYTSIEGLRAKFGENRSSLYLIAMHGKKRSAVEDVLMDLSTKATESKQCVVITTENENIVQEVLQSIDSSDSKCGVITDNLKWDQLSSDFQETLLSKIVHFQDHPMTLKSLLSSCSPDEVKQLLTKLETKMLTQLINDEKPIFCKNTLKSRPTTKYYIHRKIISRSLAISKEILDKGNSDEKTSFVLTGMQRHELTKLDNGTVSGSEEQIRPTSAIDGITAKYIILSKDKPKHFSILCKRIKENPNETKVQNLHWLHFNKERGHLEVVKSFGSLSLVQKHIINLVASPEQRDKYALPEQQLVSELVQQADFSERPAICISDNPGMGKTTLMAHIGDQLRSKILEDERQQSSSASPKFVQYFVMTELMRDLEQLGIKKEVNLSTQVILNIMLNRITETEVVRHLFQRKGTKCELMLDGFDEVLPHQAKLAIRFILLIRHEFIGRDASPIFRIWLTTRPILLPIVEQTLGVLGYNMLPFDQNDQQEFMKKYWTLEAGKRNIKLDPDKLESFSKGSLSAMEKVNNKMSQFEVEMTGIPLQCLLLAQICEGSVNYECSEGGTLDLDDEEPETLEIKNMADLYQRVMDKKLEIFLNRESSNSHLESHLSQNNKQVMKRIHMKLALELLFPEWLKEFEIMFLHDSSFTPEELSIYGFVTEYSQNNPVFVHRTYAEYFVALFAVEMGTCERLMEGFGVTVQMSRFYLNGVLSTSPEPENLKLHTNQPTLAQFQMPVVTYFIDELLQIKMANQPIPRSLRTSICNYLGEIQEFEISSSKILACITNDRPNLAKLLITSLDDSSKQMWLEKSAECHVKVVYAAALRGQKDGLEMICNLVEEYANQQISNLSYDDFHNPVLGAVIFGKRDNVEYLVQTKGCRPEMWAKKDQEILHKCVKHSVHDNSRKIEKLQEIIYFLVQNQGSQDNILEHRDFLDRTPLIAENVHWKVKMTLIDAGASIQALNRDRNYVLHTLGDFTGITPEIYHELVVFIEQNCLDDEERRIVFTNKNTMPYFGDNSMYTPDWYWHDDSPLHLAVGHLEVLNETLDLFAKYGYDFKNDKNSDDLTVLHVAIKFGRSMRLISKLEELGNNVFEQSLAGMTTVHEAALVGNLQYLQWVYEVFEDVDFNDGDYNQRTALHYAMTGPPDKREQVVKFLIEKGADPNSLNNEDETPLTKSLYDDHCITIEFLNYLKNNGANILGNREGDKTEVIWALYSSTNTKMDEENDMGAVAKYLIAEGADLCVSRGHNKKTLIDIAAENGWLRGLQLIENAVGEGKFKEMLECTDSTGSTPTHSAIKGKHKHVLKYLIRKLGDGVVHESCGRDGVRPLHVCAKVGWVEGMEILLEGYGVDVMQRDDEGNTVLHVGYTTEGMRAEVVGFLVERMGEEARGLQNNNGETPEQYGNRCDDEESKIYEDFW